MPTTYPIVVRGILQPDGTVNLEESPNLPPGPVQVTLQQIPRQIHRLPDPPLEDPSALPPLDLPRMGPIRPVHPVRVTKRLPDLPLDENTRWSQSTGVDRRSA